MYYVATDMTTESVFAQDLPEGLQGLPKRTRSSSEGGIPVAGEDHDKELAKVMAVCRAADLQQFKLEPQLFLLSEMLQELGRSPPDSTSLVSWTF